MGIKFLNKILRDNCDQSIWELNISELKGKKIAVDISIYLYKYESSDTLLENMYLMLTTFRQHNIIPIFIFDGKPPPEKKQLLQKRREDKMAAKNEFNKLKDQFDAGIIDKKVQDQMDQLKKQFVYITYEKIEQVKNLIRAYGATYYDAPGEADELCAMLVIKKKVWACLSEDMDLFVYGCNRVLRYFSLTNQSIVLYYTKGILETLNMSQKEFREICVLSGTDYNINANTSKNNNGTNVSTIYDTIKLFRKYQEQEKNNNINLSFYDWLQNAEKNTDKDYITNLDLDLLLKINNMFILTKTGSAEPCANLFKNIKIANGPIQKDLIKEIMKGDGFMFIS
jgi:flap endonuclease-1